MTFLILIIVIIAVGLVSIYNRLVTLKNRTQEAWADIDVQLKRRYDLIPNLVETVKGYAAHESSTFDRVTQARAQAMGATGLKEKGEAENALSQTLKSLFAISENYPQLRATENFQKLQADLTDTEDKIQAARRFYNGNVRDLNTSLEAFPSNVVGNMFGFKKMDFFEIGEGDQAAREPVQVKF